MRHQLAVLGLACRAEHEEVVAHLVQHAPLVACLLYTSDAADERSSVDLGGRRIIKKKKPNDESSTSAHYESKTLSSTKTIKNSE